MIAKASQTSQNHEKLRNIEKHEKHQETSCMTEFSTFKMNFRSADVANQKRGGVVPGAIYMICCVRRAKIHFEGRKIDQS